MHQDVRWLNKQLVRTKQVHCGNFWKGPLCMQRKGTTKGPHGHRVSVRSERYHGTGRQHRRKEKDSLVVKIKLRQGFANGSFPSGFVFQGFPLFFLSHISLFSFKKHTRICISISKETSWVLRFMVGSDYVERQVVCCIHNCSPATEALHAAKGTVSWKHCWLVPCI